MASLAPIEAAADRDDRECAALNNDVYATKYSTQPMASEQHRKRRTSNHLSPENVPSKKPRLTGRRRRAVNFSPVFWDNLTKVSLTPRALRELDRRNSLSVQTVKCTQPVDIPSHRLADFARHGGPDLRHLRAYPEPSAAAHNMTSKSSPASSRQSTKDTSVSRKTKRSSAYDGDFAQHLVDHNIYPESYEFPRGRSPPEIRNMESIQQDLSASRASLSPSRFSDSSFQDFQRKNKTVSEGTIMRNVIPIIAGNVDIPNEGDLPFTNLKSMTEDATVKPVPGFFNGAHRGDIDKAVIQELDRKIILMPQ